MIQDELIYRIINIVGEKNVLIKPRQTAYYRKGFRSGEGGALAVVFPTTLLEQWDLVKVCVELNCIIIIQAAKTGLTEGSSPNGYDYDRNVLIINTLRINQIHLIDDGKQAVSLSGATLHTLEECLDKINRLPHSVIGSSQIGATVVGGIANNSGGALVKRGPAYTELAIFAQIDKNGKLKLINHLEIDGLGQTPEEILTNIQEGNINSKDIRDNSRMASDQEYIEWIRDVNSDTPSRFNADKRRLFEASGCAGKLCVFAVRTDTFRKPTKERVFYLGTNSPKKLSQLRKDILQDFTHLPDMAEYMHRTIFNLTESYGKDTFFLIKLLGTKNMPKFFTIKAKIESYLEKVPLVSNSILDILLFYFFKPFPNHLPKKILKFRDKYEHHLIVSSSDNGIKEMQNFLNKHWCNSSEGDFFVCSKSEGDKALLHRFASGVAATRYQAMHKREVEGVLPLDIALCRNDENWNETLSKEIEKDIVYALYYGHFLCNVFHQNYVLKKGADKKKIKSAILSIFDKKGAKYPAEHNVGHLYKAEENLQNFYKKLDPTNTFNPGVGKMSKYKNHCNCC